MMAVQVVAFGLEKLVYNACIVVAVVVEVVSVDNWLNNVVTETVVVKMVVEVHYLKAVHLQEVQETVEAAMKVMVRLEERELVHLADNHQAEVDPGYMEVD